MKKSVIFIILTTFLFACGRQNEHIYPFANPVTTAQQQGEDPDLTIFRGNLTFDEIEVNQPVKVPIPVLGSFFQEFGNIFANMFVQISSNWEVDQDADFTEIPEMDLEFVENIEITDFTIEVISGSENRAVTPWGRMYTWLVQKRARLDFIKKINIYLSSPEMLSRGEKIHLASYHHQREDLSNHKRKMHFRLVKDESGKRQNLVELMHKNSKLFIIPQLEIHKIPRRDFKIRGAINYEVKFKLPF